MPPPDQKSRSPPATDPLEGAGGGLTDETDEVVAVELGELVVLAVLLPPPTLHLFQLVATQPSLVLPVVVAETVEVVLEALLAVDAPTAIRQTSPATPAFLHAAASLTNRRYSLAEAPKLPIANRHTPTRDSAD